MFSHDKIPRNAKIKAPGGGASTLELTKIDIAEAEIRTAVRLFFEDSHPVPVYVLASSAREILTTIATKVGVKSVLHVVAQSHGVGLKEAVKGAHQWAKFFKHADRDATARIHFEETEIDPILYTACNDFGRVTGGMPIEAQVFTIWIMALAFERIFYAPLREQWGIRRAIKRFPGIRSADRRT